jgi:serine/threonine protein kinase/tetratricopeptide (TPR) repeat protein
MSTANPQRLGRYIVTRRLGVGGMAEVFLARSRGAEGVDKSLVVKRILPDFAENPHFRAMFVDEARVAMRLNHPNLVQVYGFESDGPTLLLIMEHVDGPDLGLLLATAQRAGEPVPFVVAAHLVRELARALHYAHERLDEQGRGLDIVHRDVSPANVLLSYEGAVKLGDFGIAHARSASFTETGLVQGKYGYMAPEQARGEQVDRRADVFALGVVLLELLLGRPWFADVPDAQTLLANVRAGLLPDVDALAPGAPEALRAVVRRAMRPRPEDRFATAREMALALNSFLHAAEQQPEAVTLEQFVEKLMPRRRASGAPSSTTSRPPPPMEARDSLPTVGPASLAPEDFGPGRDGVGRTMPAFDPYASVTLPELMLLSDVAAPRPPRVDAVGAVRERVNVAVIVGRISRPAHSPETRALVQLIDALAFKAAATLEWNGDDRFTLLVGVLRPQVDDPLRAARLALDLLDAARDLAADLESVDEALVELAPTLGLGLARGLVACAFDPDGVPMRFEPVDDALPIANGLAAAARPGEALLGAALARFVRRAFVLREASPRAQSGGRVWALERLRGRSERDTSAEVQGYALLGREGAMGELRDAYDAVIFTEVGAARRVVGELGIGKSTLLGAFAEGLLGGATPTRVLRVEASLGTSRVPFALIAQLLQQVLVLQRSDDPLLPSDLVDREVLGRALDRAVHRWGAGTLGRRAAVRALRSCLGLDAHDESAESAITRELALVLRPMLSETAQDGPLVLLLDGLELADGPSRALVADLARRPPGAPVLVVLALRDDDGLQTELGGVPEIVVGPLDHDARRRLVAQSLGADHASDALMKEVSAVVGGNPLAMLEVVEALSERDRVRARAQADGAGEIVADLVTDDRGEALLPGTLDEVLAARIDALPPSSRALLRWCALCEAELTRPLVDALGGQEGARVRARLVTDGILVETPGAVLSFAHAALRRLLRAAVDPTALPAMHARLAEVLERLEAPPAAVAQHHTALAIHREAAGATRPAARAWMDAAQALLGAGARGQRQAGEALERVLSLCAGARDLEGMRLQATAWEALEEAARAGMHNRKRRRALLALREVAVASQDPGVIARALTRQARFKIEITPGLDTARDVVAAVRAARRAGDARTEAEARWAWSVHLGHRGELRAAIEQADAALHALRREAEVPRPLEVEVLVTRSTMRRWVAEHRAALELGAEAVATATRFGPRRLLGAGYDAVGMACMASGAPAEALRFFRTAISLEREAGGRDRLARTVLHAGKAWGALGRPTRALQFTQRAVALAEAARHGFGGTLAEALVTLAEQLLDRGDVDDAAAAIERARALLGTTGGRYAYVRLCLGDGRLLMARRQYRLARVAAESAEAAAAESGILMEVLRARSVSALAAAHLGDRAAAMNAIERVLGDPMMADPARIHRGARVLRACAGALRVLGDVRGGDVTSADAMAQQAGALERAVMATWRVAPREVSTT